MADARGRAEWARFSSLMALLANCHRDPKRSRAFRPHDFDPLAQAKAATPADMQEMKEMFLKGNFKRRQAT